MKKIKTGLIKLNEIKHIENSRMRKEDDVSDLMFDIEQRGLLQNIGVRAGDNALIFRNRRVKAFEKLGYDVINADFFDDITDSELLLMNLAENIKRKNIGSIEVGRICKMLRDDEGMTTTEIGVKLGISKGRVQSCVSAYTVTLNTPFEKLVIEGKAGVRGKGIPDGVIWKIQTSLGRAFGGHKINKQQWNILLRAVETEKLNGKNLGVLRGILMSMENKDLNKALEVLDKCKIIYPYMSVNEKEWVRAMAKEKIYNDLEMFRFIVKKYNNNLLF